MSKPHKHRDVIIAWANGEEIEFRLYDEDEWEYVKDPAWVEGNQYRIKPKIVKREGWVNIHPTDRWLFIYKSKKEADSAESASDRVACIRIEWEQEV